MNSLDISLCSRETQRDIGPEEKLRNIHNELEKPVATMGQDAGEGNGCNASAKTEMSREKTATPKGVRYRKISRFLGSLSGGIDKLHKHDKTNNRGKINEHSTSENRAVSRMEDIWEGKEVEQHKAAQCREKFISLETGQSGEGIELNRVNGATDSAGHLAELKLADQVTEKNWRRSHRARGERKRDQERPGLLRKRSSSLDHDTLNQMRTKQEAVPTATRALRKVSSETGASFLYGTRVVEGLLTTTLCSTDL